MTLNKQVSNLTNVVAKLDGTVRGLCTTITTGSKTGPSYPGLVHEEDFFADIEDSSARSPAKIKGPKKSRSPEKKTLEVMISTLITFAATDPLLVHSVIFGPTRANS